MQTQLAEFIKHTPQGIEADSILRSCVHCGFCTATCPTYNLLGDELDGPRGRIYQIKLVLEGQAANRTTQLHLDRCLTCRNCETTCPSGVQYGRLLDIGREVVSTQVSRSVRQQTMRWMLRKLLTTKGLFEPCLRVGRMVRPLLPAVLKNKIPLIQEVPSLPTESFQRKIILAEGCVQPAYKPATNITVKRVLHRLGIEAITVSAERCCGAVSHHLDAHEEAKQMMRANIDAWWPYIEAGAEAIVSSASGCGVLIKDYGHILRDDINYAEKACKVSDITRDLVEIIDQEDLSKLEIDAPRRVAFQAPCTLQHGQKLAGRVENILRDLGFNLTSVPDPHFCCGSAGTYSILQKDLSTRLQQRKIESLESGAPQAIVTANIGCQLHLESVAKVPVMHWIELLDDAAVQL